MSEPKSTKASKKQPQHSLLPWKVVDEPGDETAIEDANGFFVAQDSFLVSEDAQLIVQAVNSHEVNEARLEVAREMAETVRNLNSQIGNYNINHDTFDIPDREWEKLMTILDKFQEMDREQD